MKKKGFLFIYLLVLMMNVSSLRGGWVGKNFFKIFLSGPISSSLVQPIENATSNLFKSKNHQSLKNYAPLLVSISTALITSRVASSYGYNHWIIKSLAQAVILSKLNQLIIPSIDRRKIDVSNVGSKLFFTHNDEHSNIKHFLNDGAFYGDRQEYENNFSLSAQGLHKCGLSKKSIIWINDTLKKFPIGFLISGLISSFVFGPLAEKMIG